MHVAQSSKQSSPSTAGSTRGKSFPSGAVANLPWLSLGIESEDVVGVRNAAPRRIAEAREEDIFFDGLGRHGGKFGEC